ncbi:hypothetical protein JY651_43520 [Pyxidicoccus parkwayensis]|uniref:Lipoprotein n=1 Tax=Pyxidicoccus parkwayensis TaxID=2813578 RepID=A0ABX7NSS3_9BACT|nr:hypothetical protein [Pyxidicoccus parkwaysis]QSQ21944.1 hypothetical protein JY651_43520 [Pyxidicoccus parkwaysis]
MLKPMSRQVLLVVASASLYACGGPSLEEGTAPDFGTSEQELTSSLTFTRNIASGDTVFTNTVSAGAAPFTYYWQTTETQTWSGNVYVSGWYQGSNPEHFWCPRAPVRGDGELIWSLKVEAYAVDATGAASAVVYKTLPCSVSQ